MRKMLIEKKEKEGERKKRVCDREKGTGREYHKNVKRF